ncbi:MAG: hypothetical protein HQ508_04960 [Candidatus Marinimicrobia bacterium]|nr:hypothetical protein [Candidatus Neomarinimicrobiota bacterium]
MLRNLINGTRFNILKYASIRRQSNNFFEFMRLILVLISQLYDTLSVNYVFSVKTSKALLSNNDVWDCGFV